MQSPHRNPLVMDEPVSGGWRFSNGLLVCRIGRDGLVSLQGCDGVEQLSGPLQLRRYRDQGEFWDAWDLAADYREHPLSLRPLGPPELHESGPLLVVVVQRFLVGTSELRLDLRLRADCPWIELVASVNWQQRHELLRLELPLAQAAVRLAADTSGGVIERPASPHTDREQERWEVPVISWFASQSAAPGGGLAVLLDGPQGVDASPEHLGMSPCCGGRRGRIPRPIGAVIDSGSLCCLYRGDGLRPGCRRLRSPFESRVGSDPSLEQERASGFRRFPHNSVPFP